MALMNFLSKKDLRTREGLCPSKENMNSAKVSINILFFILLLLANQAVAAGIAGGEVVGRQIYGLAVDYQGDPLLESDRPVIYPHSDSDEVISVEDKRFLVSIFKHTVGGVYITTINTETQKYLDTSALDVANIEGLSSPTGSISTAWNSLLLTEGALIDAARPQSFIEAYKSYYKEKANLVKPYNYGWVSEVIVLNAQGEAKVIKNFAMGRVFSDQLLAMPDGRTFYMLDSEQSGNLYLFIAEKKYSLAKGALYVVNREQGELVPLLLGETSAIKIKFRLNKINYSTIFEVAEPNQQRCESGFKYINSVYGEECLKLKSKNKKYAGIFEPIRSAALKGVNSFSSDVNGMAFDAQSTKIIFSKNDGSKISFSVGDHPQLDSQYIIQE